ncbi:MAG TPA: aspartyl protease family protein [Candidatus Elarobacter sp.]|nr:aspartyl protease family protein [Candidatus Elarobacter sp.]
MFQAVRAHTGGARWDRVAELRADGRTFGSGLPGTTAMALDLRTGRSAVTDESAVVREKVVRLTDVMWEQDLTGGVHPMDAPDARAAARTTAYLVRNGFFRPATDPARFTCLPDAHEDGTLLRRVEVVPRGGRAVTLWIDPSAHVIVRAQQQAPTHVETISYGAYRAAGGLLLPHEIIEADDRPEDTVVRTVRRYRVASAVDARDFARPPEPANERWRDGATSTQLDIDVDAGAPVVDAYVDGKGPFAFILDTGGHAILTAEAAKNLGLTVVGAGVSGGAGEGTIQQGFARVRSVRIGDAEITDFPMFVIPYPKEFSDRGSAKPPLAGILGLEVFERFAVTIDYVHRTLRLQSPHRFRPPPGDRGVRIVFQEDEPLAWARADGVTGLFGLDTGNGGRAFLFGDFLRRNGFFRRYAAGATSRSLGTGGAVFASTYRLEELTFGGLTMHEFPTNFVVQRKGSFSSRTEAGNLGHDVLAQFALTTDYAHGVMYVHPEPGAPLPAYPGTGLSALSRDAQGHFVVQAVIARSPAADAGIAKGDVVLAIDGTPTDRMAPADLAALARRPAGTALRFTVRSGTAQREVTLTTRNLLCNAGAARCEPWVETAR